MFYKAFFSSDFPINLLFKRIYQKTREYSSYESIAPVQLQKSMGDGT